MQTEEKNTKKKRPQSGRRNSLQKCFHSLKYTIDHTNVHFFFLISLQTCSHSLNYVNSFHCFIQFLLYYLLHLISSDCSSHKFIAIQIFYLTVSHPEEIWRQHFQLQVWSTSSISAKLYWFVLFCILLATSFYLYKMFF